MRDDDVIVIGSGAGGGTLAHRLATTGKRILLLERGDRIGERLGATVRRAAIA
jgi:choline dehydrogenase-like flavoprotein